jgi:hypothetical protein
MKMRSLRIPLNAQLSEVFTRECGDAVTVTLTQPERLVIETKDRGTFRKAMEFGREAGLKIIEGDFDPETDMNWASFSYSDLGLLKQQVPL